MSQETGTIDQVSDAKAEPGWVLEKGLKAP